MFYPKNMGGNLKGWEYLPAAAGSYKAGQLLNATGGKLTAIAAASKTTPGYVCMADMTVEAGQILPVQRVQKGELFVTTLSADAAGAAVGSLLEVTAGGLQVDAAAAGTFEVAYIEGTTAGSEVCGRFQ